MPVHVTRRYFAVMAVCVVLASLAGPAAVPGALGATAGGEAAPSAGQAAADPTAFGSLPLSFERNAGQTDATAQFLARGAGYTLYLTADEAVLALRPPDAAHPASARPPGAGSLAPPEADATVQSVAAANLGVLRLQLVGAQSTTGVADAELSGKVNYFRGSDPAQWRTDIPTYARVRFPEVYPGIDLVYYGRDGQLEYDFVVTPGADPSVIALQWAGADGVALDEAGDLALQVAGDTLRQQKPLVYQEVAGARQPVAGEYALDLAGEVRFVLGTYDRSRPLVIDPTLVYARYLGGSGTESGNAIARDSQGNLYVAGWTNSTDFPTQNAFQPAQAGGGNPGGCFSSTEVGTIPCGDAFVTKLNAQGTALVYSTYLGGSRDDRAFGIGVDAAGNAYVVGQTYSANFPTVNALDTSCGTDGNCNNGNSVLLTDAFVTKLNAQGNGLVYSTYLGGSNNDLAAAIAVDGPGNAVVVGETQSADFPTHNAFQPTNLGPPFSDAFIAKLTPSGTSLVYSTYYGIGNNSHDHANAVALDSAGNAYVAGSSQTSGCSGSFCDQAYVLKIDPQGSGLTYRYQFHAVSAASAIAVDSAGNAYVGGSTTDPNFPTTPGAYDRLCGTNPTCNQQPSFDYYPSDGFVAKLNPQGDTLLYSTFLGGSQGDGVSGLALDGAGHAYVVGFWATDFPTQNPLPGTVEGVGPFVAKLNAAGSSLVYAVRPGGNIAAGIAVDSSGTAYVVGAGNAGTPPQGVFGASNTPQGTDAFISVIADQADLALSKTASPDPPRAQRNLNYTLTVTNNGPAVATGVTVTDALPASVTYFSVDPTQGTCAGVQQIVCSLGNLAVGGSATVHIVVQPTSGGPLTNSASVASDQFDPNPANNQASHSTTAGAASCASRPPVNVQAQPVGPGRLQATITVGTNSSAPTNQIHGYSSTRVTNAVIDFPGGPTGVPGFATIPPPGTQQITFVVRQVTAGQPSTVELAITDDCGDWPTVVGGGPNVFQAPTITPTPTATVTASPTGILTQGPAPVGTPQPTAPRGSVPASCAPRPPVSITTAPGEPGRLNVTVRTDAGAHATVRALRFGAASNALIDAGDQSGQTGSFVVTLPAGTPQVSFAVRQVNPAQAVSVPLTVTDDCGDWPTFVGGGPAVFQSGSAPAQTAPSAPVVTPSALATPRPTATPTPSP